MALALDAALWGGLRDYIDLPSLVFAKLPLDAFFRLRVVCKEWNHLASDRVFLLEHFSSLQPPYFVVETCSGARLLRRDAGWMWTRLPPVKCDSAGLLMVHSDDFVYFNCVFDLHTRMMYVLPDVEWGREVPGEEMEGYEEPVVGMIVDATVKPYAFRVVLGDELIGTRIYDSRSGLWMLKDSTHEDVMPGTRPGSTVSAFCDDTLYIRTPSLFSLHVYHVRHDQWSVEVLPGYPENYPPGYDECDEWMCSDFGVWKDKLYMVGLSFLRPRRILVWELLMQDDMFAAYDYSNQDFDGTWAVFGRIWRVLDGMPDDLWLWLFAGKEEKVKRDCWAKFFDIKSRFCGEYVLVYNSVACENLTEERAVLYNLNSKIWEKVDLPDSTL